MPERWKEISSADSPAPVIQPQDTRPQVTQPESAVTPVSAESVNRSSVSAMDSPAAWARFLLVAGVFLALDLWTKSLAFRYLVQQLFTFPDGTVGVISKDPYVLIPGLLEFQAVINHGAVFGFGQGQRYLFLCVHFIAIPFLIHLFASSKNRWFYQLVIGLLLAGVLGNLYDRLFFGYVRDLIHGLSRWPNLFPYVFNVADTCLCVGVPLVFLCGFWSEKDEESKAESAG
jgi:signal peptidase II